MMTPHRHLGHLAATGLLGLVCGACAPDIEVAGGWVPLEDLGVLGLAFREEGTADAYICGTGDHVEQSQWLYASDGRTFASTDGDWILERDGDAFVLESPAASWEGELTVFSDASAGGLYDASPEACRSGAVVHDGEISGTWCNGLGAFRQVEPVDTFQGVPLTISVRLREEPTYIFSIQRLP